MSTEPRPDEREAIVPARGDGERLDRFLATHFPNYSRRQLMRVIREGLVQVNGRTARPGVTLSQGDRLRLPVLHRAVAAVEAERDAIRARRARDAADSEVQELHRDDALLVVSKPAGLVVHGGAGVMDATLVDHLRVDVLADYGLVHRLDRDTSGAIALVRGKEARRRIADAFATPGSGVEKMYEAITSGAPADDEGVIDLPLAPPGHRGTARVDRRHGRPAQTRYQVLERFTRSARVALWPETGRTHQLRVHLAAIGCPLLVDPLYGGRRRWTIPDPRGTDPARVKRTPLHARRLSLPHPTSGETIAVQAPVPNDMQHALSVLRVITARGMARGGLPEPPGSDAEA